MPDRAAVDIVHAGQICADDIQSAEKYKYKDRPHLYFFEIMTNQEIGQYDSKQCPDRLCVISGT